MQTSCHDFLGMIGMQALRTRPPAAPAPALRMRVSLWVALGQAQNGQNGELTLLVLAWFVAPRARESQGRRGVVQGTRGGQYY